MSCIVLAYGQGRWYEIARYSHDVEKDADCVIVDYFPAYEGGKLVIHANLSDVINNKATTFRGGIIPTAEAGKIVFYTEGDAAYNIPVTVLTSDNANYVLFYNCDPGDGKSVPKEVFWIASRTPSINKELETMIHKYLDETHFLNEKDLIWDHLKDEDCLIN